jgi:hypothetical protein
LPWKGVGDFLKELEHGSIVADVGITKNYQYKVVAMGNI